MSDTWNPAGTVLIKTDDGKRENSARGEPSAPDCAQNVTQSPLQAAVAPRPQ
jgi:hypothetical protein